jgi:hypothetical protein
MANGDEVAAARLASSVAARGRRTRRQALKNAKANNSLHDTLNVRCGECGGRTRLTATDGDFEAHKAPAGAWCHAGAKPTAVDRKAPGRADRGKPAKRSIREISSGLPTLGKGR